MSTHVETRPPSQAREPGRRSPRSSARSFRLARLDLKVSPYLYVAPFFIIFAVFGLYPLVYTFWVSLHDWMPGDLDPQFIGFDNYVEIWTDEKFWNSVENTFGIFILSTVPQLILALMLANALNRRIRGRTFFRMTIAVPIITSTAAVAIIFGQLFNTKYGGINYVLEFAGVKDHIDWHAERFASWGAIAVMVDWRWVGYNALIYLAGMQSIPKDLYESAAIDGAGPRRQFWQITVPMLRPTIIFTVIISTIGGMQLFTEPLLFEGGQNAMSGGSMNQFQTVTMYLYQAMFTRQRFGYAATVAWALFLLIVLIALVNYLITRRINSAGK